MHRLDVGEWTKDGGMDERWGNVLHRRGDIGEKKTKNNCLNMYIHVLFK